MGKRRALAMGVIKEASLSEELASDIYWHASCHGKEGTILNCREKKKNSEVVEEWSAAILQAGPTKIVAQKFSFCSPKPPSDHACFCGVCGQKSLRTKKIMPTSI